MKIRQNLMLLGLISQVFIVACASLSTGNTQNSYNIGYNSAANTCNDIIYYSKKYNKKSGVPSTAAESLWGLITTSDVGYANSTMKLAGQIDAVNNTPKHTIQEAYSTDPFLDKCNFNPQYARYCSTAYDKYLAGYDKESEDTKNYDRAKYKAGFNDGANACGREFISPPPITPLELK